MAWTRGDIHRQFGAEGHGARRDAEIQEAARDRLAKQVREATDPDIRALYEACFELAAAKAMAYRDHEKRCFERMQRMGSL